jgi:hypothetical protein
MRRSFQLLWVCSGHANYLLEREARGFKDKWYRNIRFIIRQSLQHVLAVLFVKFTTLCYHSRQRIPRILIEKKRRAVITKLVKSSLSPNRTPPRLPLRTLAGLQSALRASLRATRDHCSRSMSRRRRVLGLEGDTQNWHKGPLVRVVGLHTRRERQQQRALRRIQRRKTCCRLRLFCCQEKLQGWRGIRTQFMTDPGTRGYTTDTCCGKHGG